MKLAAALALSAGCSGEIGAHVTVTLPAGMWDDNRPFDHIRVAAGTKNKTEVACLFPLDNVEVGGVVTAVDPGSSDPLACANLGPLTIDSSLGAESWGLAGNGARTVNFVWPNDDQLDLAASAGFGAKIDLLTAKATVKPGTKFPDVTLQLGSPAPPFLGQKGCPIDLSKVAHDYLCPDDQTVNCLAGIEGTRHHTPGMFALHGLDPRDPGQPGCRVYNNWSACPQPPGDLFTGFMGIVDVPAKKGAAQIDLYATLRARFAGCASGDVHGDCPITTHCDEPLTSLVMSARENAFSLPKFTPLPILCLPPTHGFIEMRVKLPATPGTVNVGVIAQLKPNPGQCFFDVLDFDYDLDVKP